MTPKNRMAKRGGTLADTGRVVADVGTDMADTGRDMADSDRRGPNCKSGAETWRIMAEAICSK